MSQSPPELLSLLEGLGSPRVLVLGDLILDRYTWGDAERVSQEAPVLVLRADRWEARLGGAASVCHLLRGLDAQVSVAGVTGPDEGGQQLRDLLTESGVNAEHVLVDPSRPSTVKHRFIGRAQNRHPHQILRVDSEERTPISAELESQFRERIERALANCDVLLISDYNKGVCTPGLLQAVIQQTRRRGLPVVVDPIRGNDYSRYRGATTMTPNRLEAQLATGLALRQLSDTNHIGQQLCEQLDLDAAIITLDRDGMALVPRSSDGVIFPTRPRNVYDITGAGDMVLAMIGLSLGAGLSLEEAVKLSNVAGGLEVEKVGVVQVTREEIRQDILEHSRAQPGKIVTLPELLQRLGPREQRREQIVFTNGCFDLLHVGHVTYLQEAAAMGDRLIVGLNSDASVRRLKGSTRPVVDQQNRATMLAALACVDEVVLFEDDTPAELIEQIQPDVLVKGGTYRPEEIVGYDTVTSYGGQVCVTDVVEGVSTTNLLHRIQGQPKAPHFVSQRNTSTRE